MCTWGVCCQQFSSWWELQQQSWCGHALPVRQTIRSMPIDETLSSQDVSLWFQIALYDYLQVPDYRSANVVHPLLFARTMAYISSARLRLLPTQDEVVTNWITVSLRLDTSGCRSLVLVVGAWFLSCSLYVVPIFIFLHLVLEFTRKL